MYCTKSVKRHQSSNISIFQNETGILDDFRDFGAFLMICSKLEGDGAFLVSDSCSASKIRRDIVV